LRNDAASVDERLAFGFSGVVISPGPKTPRDAGISLALIAALPPRTPLLGVCLGHQCLVEAFGGETLRAQHPLHGEARRIRHDGAGLFKDVEAGALVGRYHSLISRLPEQGPLVATAWSDEGELMAVAHRKRPWFGVQFHPESLLTPCGRIIIRNFLSYCRETS